MPAPTWNQIFSTGTAAGFNWQAEAVMNMFVSAEIERLYDLSALGPFTSSGATGYNLQSVALWSGGSVHGPLASMQQFIITFDPSAGFFGVGVGNGGGGWLKNIDLTGIAVSPAAPILYNGIDLFQEWLFDNCKTASATFAFAATGADGTYHSSKGFSAKYPKAFSSLTSSVYPDFLSVVIGDYARYTTNGLVYHCTAITAGVPTWVKAPTHLPDRRDASEGGFRNYFGSGISAPYGLMMHGDYGPPSNPALMNELRDALNAVRKRDGRLSDSPFGTGISWTADGANNVKDSGFIFLSPGTSAAAKAAADAAYAASASSLDTYPFAWSRVDTGAGDADAQTTRAKAKAFVGTDNDGLTPAIEFYNYNADADVFDANGDAVTTTTYTKFDTGAAAGAGADVKSAFLGTLVEPTWAADNAGARGYGRIVSTGFVVLQGISAFDYGVAGAFVYRA